MSSKDIIAEELMADIISLLDDTYHYWPDPLTMKKIETLIDELADHITEPVTEEEENNPEELHGDMDQFSNEE